MEFAFHLSPYDAPFLEEEAARLLAQRLEAAGVLTGDQLAGAQVNSPRLR